MSYQKLMPCEALLKELDLWCDVCFIKSMEDFGNLGGYTAEEIPKRFEVLAESYKAHEITYHEGLLAVSAQFGQEVIDE